MKRIHFKQKNGVIRFFAASLCLLISVLCIMSLGKGNDVDEKDTADETNQVSYLTINDIDRSMNRRFKTIDKLKDYISEIELDTTRFKLLHEKNSIPVPSVPDSWGDLVSVHIDAVGCVTYEYQPNELHGWTNNYQVAIRTYEAYEEKKNDYVKSLNSGNISGSLADGSVVFLDQHRGNEISWLSAVLYG